ncbi:DUF2971 domain-containing protein [Leptospira meyeri]|uniref:DUF2971 domain-containing protein n=1 Tax=Leptospira meyeri TaxID=29508 RepID=UPI0010834738|nr:DUF2971 domain-containing protein [Leptospira meyeri]TGL15259.1 DUF2971 domain-containing protein [Leptospira meyeri]
MNKIENSEIMNIVFQVAKTQNLIYRDFAPICHYTKGIGLNGILHSKYLRANHVSNLNDLSEIIRAYQILIDILKEVKTKSNPEIIENLIEDLQSRIDSKIYPEIYIVSFSKNIDDLFLWRSYTSFNDAYALIFTKAFIAEYGASVGAELLHCIYDKSKQINILKQVIDLFTSNIMELREFDIKNIKDAFFKLIHLFVPFIKNPQFKAENEVRLVLRNPINLDSENRIRIGLSNNNFYKYVNLPIVRNQADGEYEHAVEEIIIGPNSRTLDENRVFKKNMKMLLDQNIGSLLKDIRDTKFNTLKF